MEGKGCTGQVVAKCMFKFILITTITITIYIHCKALFVSLFVASGGVSSTTLSLAWVLPRLSHDSLGFPGIMFTLLVHFHFPGTFAVFLSSLTSFQCLHCILVKFNCLHHHRNAVHPSVMLWQCTQQCGYNCEEMWLPIAVVGVQYGSMGAVANFL